MSIPERLWRVVRGHWSSLGDRLDSVEEKLAQAAAYEELADTLRPPPPGRETAPPPAGPGRAGPAAPPPAAAGHDPLEASYALLQVEPGAGLEAVEEAYEARMDEIEPEKHPAGSADRRTLEARRSAVQAAYDRLRDALNPTETRFERLEF